MYFVTGPANADIDKYMQWQREQWGVNVATRWFNNLYARFDSLAAMPGQAAECEWAPGLIEITRVVHSSMDQPYSKPTHKPAAPGFFTAMTGSRS